MQDTTIQATRYMLECGLGRDEDNEQSNAVGARKAAKEQISMVLFAVSRIMTLDISWLHCNPFGCFLSYAMER